MIGIYCITNKINGKKYIGQSVNIHKRWRVHIAAYDKNSIISKAILKYGKEIFKFEILEECKREDLNNRECYWIKKYETFKNNDYNSTTGGGVGIKISEETKRKISISHMGEKNPMYGKEVSKETRRKIGLSHMGEKHHFFNKGHTEESKKKMSLIKKGKNHPMYGKEISKETRRKIGKANKGRKFSLEIRINNARVKMNGVKIGCSNGKIYKSLLEAYIDTNTRITGIFKVCEGKYKKSNNLFFWRIFPEK